MFTFIKNCAAALVDFVFGYDFFISYKHTDGHNYPEALADGLMALGYVVFLDKRSYVPGDDLTSATRRRVRMSSALIVLGRPGALTESPWVLREVVEAQEANRTLVLIDFCGSLAALQPERPLQAARLRQFQDLFENRLRIPEGLVAGDETRFDGAPTENTIAELQRSLKSVRQDTWRARFFGAAAVLLFGLLVFAGIQIYRVSQAEAAASREARQAKAGELAALSELRQIDQPLTSARLAIEAVEITHRMQEKTPALARQAVLQRLTEIGGDVLLNPSPNRVIAFDVSDDGRWLAAEDGTRRIRIWDLRAPRRPPQSIPPRIAAACRENPSFRCLHGFIGNTLVFWNDGARPPTAENRQLPESLTLLTSSDAVVRRPGQMALNFNRRRAVAASGNSVWLWSDLDGDRQLTPEKIASDLYTAHSVILSADGSQALIAPLVDPGLWTIRLADGAATKASALAEPKGRPARMASAERCNLFVSLDDDGAAHVWEPTESGLKSTQLRSPQAGVDPYLLDVSPNGQFVALSLHERSSDSNIIEIWKRGAGGAYQRLPGVRSEATFELSLSADGQFLFAASIYRAALFQVSDTEAAELWSENYGVDETVCRVATGKGGKTIVLGHETGEIRVVRPSLPAQRVVRLRGHQHAIADLKFSSDGRILYSLCEDGLLKRWDINASSPGHPLAIAPASEEGFKLDVTCIDAAGRTMVVGEDRTRISALDFSGAPRIAQADLPRIESFPLLPNAYYHYGLSPNGQHFFVQGGYPADPDVLYLFQRSQDRPEPRFRLASKKGAPTFTDVSAAAIDDDSLYVARGKAVYRRRHATGVEVKFCDFDVGSLDPTLILERQGRRLAIEGHSSMHIWERTPADVGGNEVASIAGEFSIQFRRFLPDGRGALIEADGILKRWSMKPETAPVNLVEPQAGQDILISDDGNFIYLSSEQQNSVVRWMQRRVPICRRSCCRTCVAGIKESTRPANEPYASRTATTPCCASRKTAKPKSNRLIP